MAANTIDLLPGAIIINGLSKEPFGDLANGTYQLETLQELLGILIHLFLLRVGMSILDNRQMRQLKAGF